MLSIIVASYNKAQFIKETIDSVVNQSISDWELIIVDDASTDSTLDILDSYALSPQIKIVKGKTNAGANSCRNKGIQMAIGNFCMFLDADDLLSPTCVENRLKTAKELPGKNMYVFTMGVFKFRIGDDAREWQPNSKDPLSDFLMHKLPWSIMQPMWETNFLKQIGGFNETYKRLQDVELHTRALLQKEILIQVMPGKPDCYYRIDEGRLNFKKFDFLSRWTEASIQYCDDFCVQLDKHKKNALKGTFYEILCQLGFQKQQGLISYSESAQLVDRLKKSFFWQQFTHKDKFIWNMAYVNNFKLKIPGVNYVLKRLLVN